jgi:hypothetical protein
MKVIFLDHDGVICLDGQWGTRFNKQNHYTRENRPPLKSMPIMERFDDFDKDCVEALNEILRITDCEIVVSSDWRSWATIEEMKEYYLSQGIIKGPIDFTPFAFVGEISNLAKEARQQNAVLECVRAFEIKKWLEQNQVFSWVAIDDMNLGMGSWGLSNFVHCLEHNGLSNPEIKKELLSFLTEKVLQ